MIFQDRIEAARELARPLAMYRQRHPLVLAIPRGAVPMGRALADALDGELDVALVRKLRAPDSPEFAVGAIDESGWMYVAPYAERVGADASYLEREKNEQLATLHRRRAMYTPGRAPLDPHGRVVIVIDDGLATGATMIAALHAVRGKHPEKLVCAVPVAAPDSLEKVLGYADDVVCLHAPAEFRAVGQYYRDFRQVEDEEVVACLAAAGGADLHG